MGTTSFKCIVPILPVRNVEASVIFFREKLGFSVDFLYGEPPFYGSISRDQVCLHLRHDPAPLLLGLATGETSSIRATIEVSTVYELFKDFDKRGVTFTQPLAKQPWGGTDFVIRDLDGNGISFFTYEVL